MWFMSSFVEKKNRPNYTKSQRNSHKHFSLLLISFRKRKLFALNAAQKVDWTPFTNKRHQIEFEKRRNDSREKR